MKNKASLVLMEQLIMILVFALAAAVCLKAFAWADRTSREIRQQSEAAILCQNAAEAIKAAGSLEEAELATLRDSLPLEVQKLEPSAPGLAQAEIRVFSPETGELLFSLRTGWQEELP